MIFGVGNDSAFWAHLNKGGTTVYLEDNELWLRKIADKHKELKIFMVKYGTQRDNWEDIVNSLPLLEMDLPEFVSQRKWDVIVVDAPDGSSPEAPGRMKSIFAAAKLVDKSGDIFVHDCNREVEAACCDKFLKKENFKVEIESQMGSLRHYHLENGAN